MGEPTSKPALVSWGYCRDDGREHENYCSMLGVYRDNGREHGKYYSILGLYAVPVFPIRIYYSNDCYPKICCKLSAITDQRDQRKTLRLMAANPASIPERTSVDNPSFPNPPMKYGLGCPNKNHDQGVRGKPQAELHLIGCRGESRLTISVPLSSGAASSAQSKSIKSSRWAYEKPPSHKAAC